MHSSIHDTAWTEMLKAGQEERRLAVEDGDVDEDGNALCTVVADGQWGKRSYKSKYDALSGVVKYFNSCQLSILKLLKVSKRFFYRQLL